MHNKLKKWSVRLNIVTDVTKVREKNFDIKKRAFK